MSILESWDLISLKTIKEDHFDIESLQGTLPSDFFEKICDLENSMLIEKDIIKIENLARLYKVGVEYYSSRNSTKASNFLYKLQQLFSNKHLAFALQSRSTSTIKQLNNRRQSMLNMEFGLQKLEEKYQNGKHITGILSTFEIKFNESLKIINNDMIKQQMQLRDRIKSKRQENIGINQVSKSYSFKAEADTKRKKNDGEFRSEYAIQ